MPLGGFGVAGFGADRPAEALDAELRLAGDGYTRATGTARVEELAAWANLFAVGLSAMDAAERGAFVRQAVELLRDWEILAGAPTDGSDTIEIRQSRLAAFHRLLGRSSDVETVLSAFGLAPNLVPNSSFGTVAVDEEAATPGALYLTSVLLNDTSGTGRRLVAWVLRAAFPAYAWGALDRADPLENVAKFDTARWSGEEIVGDARLADTKVTLAQGRPRSRFRDWCVGTTVKAIDLNEIQYRMMLGGCVGVSQSQVTPGSREVWFTCEITNGSTKDITLAGGSDFRTRLARIMLRSSATDVRPGNAGDTSFNASSYSSSIWYTGTGGAGYAWAAGGGISVTASAVDGHLTVTNASGGTRYVTIWVELSGATNAGVADVKPAKAVATDPPASMKFSTAGIDKGWYAAVLPAISQAAANGSGADAWTGFPTTQFGGLVRVFSLGASTRPGSLATSHFIDRTIDWRDRLLSVFVCGVNSSHGALGAPGDAQVTVDDTLMWTGSGATIGQAALQNYAVAIGNVRLMVHSLTGALVIDHHTASAWDQASVSLIVHATDQLGKRTSAAALAMPVDPDNGIQIHATQLNFLQDLGMASQGKGRDGDEPWFTQSVSDDSNAALSSSVMSFGPALRGWSDTKFPARYSRGFADGQIRSRFLFGSETREEQRDFPQYAFGRLRRVLAAAVPDATSSDIDATDSWNDRIVVAWIAVSASDLRPGNAADNTVAANGVRVSLYSGQGSREIQLAASGVYVKISGTKLQIRNASGGLRYVTGWVEASFQCGCR